VHFSKLLSVAYQISIQVNDEFWQKHLQTLQSPRQIRLANHRIRRLMGLSLPSMRIKNLRETKPKRVARKIIVHLSTWDFINTIRN